MNNKKSFVLAGFYLVIILCTLSIVSSYDITVTPVSRWTYTVVWDAFAQENVAGFAVTNTASGPGDIYIAKANVETYDYTAPDGTFYPLRRDHIYGYTFDGTNITRWGGFGNTCPGCFMSPGRMAFDSDNNLYVIDATNTVRKFNRITGEVLSILYKSTSKPTGVDVDKGGNVYVTDGGIISKFDPAGVLLWKKPGAFASWDVATDSQGNIYILDSASQNIQKYSPDFGLIWKIPFDKLGASSARPEGIYVDKLYDIIYVADSINDRVVMYDSAGNEIYSFGTAGTGLGQFTHPLDIASDSDNLYVLDGIVGGAVDGRSITRYKIDGLPGISVISKPICGDKHIDASIKEVCDDGTIDIGTAYGTYIKYNGNPCPVVYNGPDCSYCSADCSQMIPVKAPLCGDHICQKEYDENSKNCIQDCGVDGWKLTGPWSLTADSRMTTNVVSNLVTSDDKVFSLKAGKTYMLTASVTNPGNCDYTIKLLQGCLSAVDWQQDSNCFAAPDFIDKTKSSANILLQPSNKNDSLGYFRNLKLKIDVSADCAAGITFDDISLKDQQYINDGITYFDYTAPSDATSGCCPDKWCWNGTECVNGYDYVSNSSLGPIWNNVLVDAYHNWTNKHVNVSYYDKARGYRCVLNNDSDNAYAYWHASSIKYDWNMKYSGYCAEDTDCFVNSSADISGIYSGITYDCIKNRMSVNDSFINDTGNHYCLNGNWTTKSYIMASALKSIAASSSYNDQDNKYILFCDTPDKVFNTNYVDGIEAACGLIIKNINDPKDETAIIGIVPSNASGEGYTSLMNSMQTTFEGLYSDSGGPYQSLEYLAKDECVDTPGNGFVQCVKYSATNLRIYYNKNYKFYLISNKDIRSFQFTLWDRIKMFFGFDVKRPEFALMNFTSNFDKIYIMKNDSLAVSGIEEKKYDEYNYSILTYMFLNFTGTSDAGNPINTGYLMNRTLPVGSTRGEIPLAVNISAADKTITIKTTKSSQLWYYMTSMLRDRDTIIS